MRRPRSVLWYVFVGSRGGETRLCIMEEILRKPQNPRQLAVKLGLDYSTIRHSLRVLEKNRLAFVPEKKYGGTYRPTPEFGTMREEYDLLRQEHTCTRHAGGEK